MKPRTRHRENPEVRRALIVDEAIRVIGQHGYNGFTIQGLASRCGLSNAGLLHYFGSKDALLLALLQELARRDTEALQPLADAARSEAADETTYGALVALLRAIVERITERPEMARFATVLQSESMDPTHPAHDWFKAREDLALDRVAALVAPWTARPRSVARLLFAAMNGLCIQWLYSNQGFDVVEEWGRAVEAILPRREPADAPGN